MATKIADLDPATNSKRHLEVKISSLSAQLKEARESSKHWMDVADRERKNFEFLAAIQEPVERSPIVSSSSESGRGVALANWSDWHVGEVVDKSKTGGRNAYSPEIARARSIKCTESTRKLWGYIKKSYDVDSMVLFLGGDFISGYLHPELAQTNAMPPVEETRYAKMLLIDAISHLLSDKSIKKMRIICARGNHGRTTYKVQFKNDYETSYESWLYWDLQDVFGNDGRVEFDVPKADVHTVKTTPSLMLRTYHGHQIKYSDGVGGLTIPLNKWQSKQDRIDRADFNLMGHYHMWSMPNSTTILNGSLKGFDEYALSHGFAFQEPLQTFALIDTKRRLVSQNFPVFCT